MSSSPLPPLKSGMCRIRVLERLHPGPLVRVKCERPGQRRLAHRRSESGTQHAWLLSLLPHSTGAATWSSPPPPTCRHHTHTPLPPWLGLLHLPSLLRGHIASGPRHNPGSRNSPGLGPTHPLENFDEAQGLLQALPAQPQEQAVHLQRQSQQPVKTASPEGKRGSPTTHIGGRGRQNRTDTCRTSRWIGASESPRAGHLGHTCGRGDLSEVRPGLSVEDMLARWGVVRAFDSLVGRLRGARGRWGRRACGRGQAGLQAGGLGRGGAAARALRGSVRRAAPPAAENPRA